MRDNYSVGDIVAGAISGVPIVIIKVEKNGNAIGLTLRHGGLKADTRTPPGTMFIPIKGHLRPFTGELTDEEQALAMKYILLEGANNG